MKNNYSIPKVEAYIENALQDWQIPGAVVALIDRGELVSARGYGVKEFGKPDIVNEKTLFSIGSCSKAFTAAVVGSLVDEGKLKWDDPIIQHLPDFKMYDPWVTQHVTIRDMLAHRTGTMRSIRIMNRDRVFDSEDYISKMEYLRPIGHFRGRFSYNNPHYLVAGRVAEVVTGKTWKDLVHERFFSPLGMTASAATYQQAISRNNVNIATPHTNLDGGLVPAELRVLDPVQPIPWTDFGENSAGSILSNLEDMICWLQLLLNEGSYNGEQILSRETVAEMLGPQIIIKPTESEMDPLFAVGIQTNLLAYGLGWYINDYRGYKMVFHPGQLHGFVAAVAFLPQLKIGGVIMMNTYQTMLHAMLGYYLFDVLLGEEKDYSGDMIKLIHQWRTGAEIGVQQMLANRPVEDHKPLNLEQFTGTYSSPMFGEISISQENDQLKYQYGETSLFIANLEPWAGLTYLVDYKNKINAPEFLTFLHDVNGEVTGLTIDEIDTFERIS